MEQRTDLTEDCGRKGIWGQTCPGTHFPPGFWDSPGKFTFGFLGFLTFVLIQVLKFFCIQLCRKLHNLSFKLAFMLPFLYIILGSIWNLLACEK